MSTLDTYRQLAPDHPVWQRPPTARPTAAPMSPPATGRSTGRPTVPDRSEVGAHNASATSADGPVAPLSGEDGSLITEYGLLAIVAATVAAAVISWASDGAMASLFDSLLQQARGIVGA